tara:strand:+ start:351 stop:1241 length:891 start_codon:yes stop_codon:yes gene_type:complete
MLVNSAITRGCGTRKKGGLYACVSSGGGNTPIEHFIVDPVIPWTHGPFQGGIVSWQPQTGAYDLIMWVGAEYYPYVPDFIEEGRVHGFSKRIPTTLEGLELLDDQSRLVLVHPRAGFRHTHHLKHVCHTIAQGEAAPHIFRPDPHASGDCNHPIDSDGETTNCTFSLWDLSGHKKASTHNHTVWEVQFAIMGELNRVPVAYQDDPENKVANIETPSVTYTVRTLVDGFSPYDTGNDVYDPPDYLGWYPGIFCVLPLTHFEYVSGEDVVGMYDRLQIPGNVADKLGDNIMRTFTTPT